MTTNNITEVSASPSDTTKRIWQCFSVDIKVTHGSLLTVACVINTLSISPSPPPPPSQHSLPFCLLPFFCFPLIWLTVMRSDCLSGSLHFSYQNPLLKVHPFSKAHTDKTQTSVHNKGVHFLAQRRTEHWLRKPHERRHVCTLQAPSVFYLFLNNPNVFSIHW